ncbi:hypothetical protein Cni_G16089 [Canna indica]|uniref:Uncharacterized protein n=1 Tax=Canna indica TaxID=4628 RepID=A0AAQ3QDX2_9LILI|nr:hypothetical protein Cni_G16089 [Canna indica]
MANRTGMAKRESTSAQHMEFGNLIFSWTINDVLDKDCFLDKVSPNFCAKNYDPSSYFLIVGFGVSLGEKDTRYI